ncbi:sodium:alanine symporter family protein [Halanaerobium sp. MA284_MarDTE_T2]|uniref:alanine/glycine:cation symporter family protein n=1 Tax=Halanaerobium sp. MA284_MarDTE_T2 TaxID=2183913 RepID=UPI000DF2689D|nr:sodium:alanine symporter family protein [Halanaerobium sp. MA284_MarDTE_T2]RCW41710.1 AGCS family alanine or glycine:cation symporter [Halanaerobium sp. MA284_MarDTE_T2]
MDSLMKVVSSITTWIWGIPMLLLLGLGGLFLTIRLGFFQIKYGFYIIQQTFGKMFSKGEGEGTISPFQAVTAALASTVGAANIVGVPTAIILGGPGAVFWMWVMAILGMGSKFSEVVLGLKYREKNEEGEYVGGPMYYIKNGLNMKWLGVIFSFFLMLELIPSIMVQANSVAASALETFNLSTSVTGIFTLIIVGLVVVGGIKRIGKVTEKLVPFMAGLYIFASLIIILMNISQIPTVLSLIFKNAFTPMSAVGGFTGSAVAATIRWGVARGIYSNEAGMGTAPMAHSPATVDHPVRQGFWAVFEIIVDTLIICSVTAFVVLSSGVWTAPGAMENPNGLPAQAFTHYFGDVGGILVTIALLLFVISTIIVITFYGEKQAEFLFGLKFSRVMRYVYLASIFVGAVGGAKIIWNFLDLLLACIILPNMIGVLLLHKDVVELKNEFFSSEKFYLKDTNKI